MRMPCRVGFVNELPFYFLKSRFGPRPLPRLLEISLTWFYGGGHAHVRREHETILGIVSCSTFYTAGKQPKVITQSIRPMEFCHFLPSFSFYHPAIQNRLTGMP